LAEKAPANQNIKLEWNDKGFNVRFYCNDGISYYSADETGYDP